MTTQIHTNSKTENIETEYSEDKLRKNEYLGNDTEQLQDNLITSNLSENIDEVIFGDVGGNWEEQEETGKWEKIDELGISLISKDDWTAAVKSRERLLRSSIDFTRRKQMLELLSSSPDFSFVLKNFLDPDYYSRARRTSTLRLSDTLAKELNEEKLSTEFISNMDEFTFLLINKMIHQFILKDITGIISLTGKKSVLLQAVTQLHYSTFKKEHLVLKIFKRNFLTHDPPADSPLLFRYNDIKIKTVHEQISRHEINSLAEKELKNLHKLKSLGIKCPEPVELPAKLRRHIVVMSLIGKCNEAAKKFKDSHIGKDKLVSAYNQIITTMRIMYQQAQLIHHDILEHILWFDEQCYFIDFGTSFEVGHADARYVLVKNIRNLTKHFMKRNIHGILSEEDFLEYVITNSDEDNT